MKKTVAPLSLLMFALLPPSAATAQTTPRQIRISYASPNTQSIMAVTWNSDSATQQFLRLGIASTGEAEFAATVSAPLGGGLGYVHSAVTTGLLPDTIYRYRVGSDGDGWAPAVGNLEFRTGPADPCAPIRFVGLGDTRGDAYLDIAVVISGAPQWPAVFDRLAGDTPDFALIAGDMVENGDSLTEWNDFFNQGTNHYTGLPVMPAFGNHDSRGAGTEHTYEQLYTLPTNDLGNEQYYYFRYGNALVIAFNSHENGDGFAAQAAWLEQVLQSNPATWKVIFFHHPVWTSTPGEVDFLGCSLFCGHPPNEKGQNPLLIDLIDRYDVDLVIQSHNHFYERSTPLRGGGSDETMLEAAAAFRGSALGTRDASGRIPTWGSLYVVTGGGGAPIIPITSVRGQIFAPGSVSVDDKPHYVRITINDLQLRYEMVRANDGSVFDNVVINKLEQYRVDTCGGGGGDGGPGDGGPPDGGGDPGGSGGDIGPGDPTPADNDGLLPLPKPEDPPAEQSGCDCAASPWPAWLLALPMVSLMRRRRNKQRPLYRAENGCPK